MYFKVCVFLFFFYIYSRFDLFISNLRIPSENNDGFRICKCKMFKLKASTSLLWQKASYFDLRFRRSRFLQPIAYPSFFCSPCYHLSFYDLSYYRYLISIYNNIRLIETQIGHAIASKGVCLQINKSLQVDRYLSV